MNISQTTLRIGAVLGTIGATVVLAASTQAATSKPAEMGQPEYRALMSSTWVRRAGEWRLALHQQTPVPAGGGGT